MQYTLLYSHSQEVIDLYQNICTLKVKEVTAGEKIVTDLRFLQN